MPEAQIGTAPGGSGPARGPVAWMSRSPGRAFAIVFALSFAVRGLLLASWMIPDRYAAPETVTELGRVARTLALTGRFADPYALPTGPTAHPLPLYTGLLALVYSVFGVTLAAGYVRCLLAITGYSTLYALLPWFAARAGLGIRAGLLAGLAAAVSMPQRIEEILGLASGESFAAVALLAVLLSCLRRWSSPRPSAPAALLAGLGFGIACLLSPAIVLVMAGCVAFELWWRWRGRRRLPALALVLGTALACAPWTARNYATFHAFFFLRSNFGLELQVGNHDGAVADLWALDLRERAEAGVRHPGGDLEEARAVRDLGEVAYMRQAKREALSWIGSHRAEFLRLTALRALYFWFGPLGRPATAAPIALVTVLALLGLRRFFPSLTAPQRAVMMIPLATYPLIYYLVPYSPRYTVPVSFVLLTLAGAEVWGRVERWGDAWAARDSR